MSCVYLSGDNYCDLMLKNVFPDECPCTEFQDIEKINQLLNEITNNEEVEIKEK